jgi:hypothetical protein
MKNTKFLVKINRVGTRGPQYLERMGKGSVITTPDRKRALLMGKFTAEDAIKAIQNARCTPELIPVEVLL